MLLPSSLLSLLLLLPSFSVAQDSHLVSSSLGALSKRHFDEQGNYNITFLHVNDIHAHLDQYRASGIDCPGPKDPSVPCLGGSARILAKAREIRSSVKDSLFLNAGDEFQGTLFYSFYGSSVISQTLNLLNFSLFTLGNHEFDAGDEPLAHFLSNLSFPTVSSNVRTNHSLLASMLHPFWVFEEHGLAVVALTTVDTPGMSKSGAGTEFGRVEDVQVVVDGLLEGTLGGEKGKKVKRVIALTHIGYEEDIRLAQNTRNIHLIVGGHSHTPLGGEAWYSQGPYPTIVKNLDGEEVFIVTSYRWGEHLGRIDVAFAPDSGKVLAYTGAPIQLTEEYPQDEHLQDLINSWRVPFEEYGKKVLGQTLHDLDHWKCLEEECTLGNAICDAMVFARLDVGAHVDGAIHNSQGMRASFPAGNITLGNLDLAFPFQNGASDVHMTGRDLWEMFENVASRVTKEGKAVTSSVQVSRNISYTYNPTNAVRKRLISLRIGGEPVDFERVYIITLLAFMLEGGDNIFPHPGSKPTPPPLFTPNEAFIRYLEEFSPLDVHIEGRVVVRGRRGRRGSWSGIWGERSRCGLDAPSARLETNAEERRGKEKRMGIDLDAS